MNTDSETTGAKAPCLLCGRSATEHSLDTADICNCFLPDEPETYRRCAICGFVVDIKFAATKPTIEYTMAGRAKTKEPFPDNNTWAMRKARSLVEQHISDYGMVPNPDRLKEALAKWLDYAANGKAASQNPIGG